MLLPHGDSSGVQCCDCLVRMCVCMHAWMELAAALSLWANIFVYFAFHNFSGWIHPLHLFGVMPEHT